MIKQSPSYATPLWIAPNQIAAVAGALKDPTKIEAVHKQLSAQVLVEDPTLFQTHAEKSVRVWGNDNLGNDFLAVAEFPNGQLTVATKGAILIAFKDCCDTCSGGANAALLTTDQQQFQFFGSKAREKVPHNPAFRAVTSDLGHYATHMIGKPHNCSGLEHGPS